MNLIRTPYITHSEGIPVVQKQLSREDLSPTERMIVLALDRTHGRDIESPDHLWVQKTIFLFRRLLQGIDKSQGPAAAGYIAYDAGPYSEEVEGALNSLIADRLIDVQSDKSFRLTPAGSTLANQIAEERPKGAAAMDTVVDLIEDLSPEELILYVYSTSPEWAKASKMKHVIEDHQARLALAHKLYSVGKISAERAADVAGIPLPSFLRSLERG